MKKLVLSLFVATVLFSGLAGLPGSTESANAAVYHDYYKTQDYRQVKLYDHVAYRGNVRVDCTVSRWDVRVITKCNIHPEEISYGYWQTMLSENHGTNHN